MSETENLLQTIKTTVQDLVAPDVRELKVRIASMDERNQVQFDALKAQIAAVAQQSDAQIKALAQQISSVAQQSDAQIKALTQQSDAQFKALLAAISQSKAETELSVFKQIAALTERVVALEARRQ